MTALVLSWWLGPRVIAWLKQLKFGQEYADKAEAEGGMAARLLSKKGTPTMGGILIVVALNLTTLLWAQWNTLVQLTLLSVVVLTGLGFYDDYAKITKQSSGGARSLRQARRASCAGVVHRAVFVARAVHPETDYGDHGAVLQVPGPDRRRFGRAGVDGADHRRQFECGES